jgi:uncharacterized protein (TIGR04255 family)
MTKPLPDYTHPPINEVACGIQFSSLSKFQSPHYGIFWESIKSEYPLFEEHPILMPMGLVQPEPAILDLPPLRRVFYIETARNYLIQLQPTRFHVNWRKVNDTDDYPRFTNISKKFYENWDIFKRFVIANKIDTPQATQYELVYINHILEKSNTFPLAFEKYFPIFAFQRSKSEDFLPNPKAGTLNLLYELPEGNGSLVFALKHGTHNQKEIAVLEITARGPARPDASNMEEWFLLAHDWIVCGFTDISSPDAHKLWGRIR